MPVMKNRFSIVKKIILIFIVIFSLFFVAISNAQNHFLTAKYNPILKIIPVSLAPLTVPSTNSVSMLYTVTNNTSRPVFNLTIDPGLDIPSNLLSIGLLENNCTGIVPPSGQCTFEVSLQGKGIAGQATLEPRVCIFSDAVCSVPVISNRIHLNILSGAGSKTLQSISVTPPSATISAGKTEIFIATGHYSDGSTANISSSVQWSSSDTADASVASGGTATGIAAGAATITATDLATYIAGTAMLNVIGGLSANSGVVSGGQTITVNGVFGANPSVTFDGNAATIISASATQIVLKTPANSYVGGKGGKIVNVVITTSLGVITLPNSYTYVGLGDPYENGVIFHLDGNGNPGGTVVSTTDDGPNITWDQANAYCASYAGGGYTGWRLPNTYAYGATPTDGGAITGEAGVLYNNNNPYAEMSVNNTYWGSNDTTINNDGKHAWMENFGSDAQLSVPKSLTSNYLYARCVRDFSS